MKLLGSWHAFFTTGSRAGTWKAYRMGSTMSPIVLGSVLLGYEREDGQIYSVKYQCFPITPMPDAFWCTEISRSLYPGVL